MRAPSPLINPGSRRWLAGAAVLLLGAGGPVLACSTCKCGDNTITLMGAEKPFGGRMRAGLDYLSRSESQGKSGVDQQVTYESRTTLGLAYSPGKDVTFALQVPFVRKEIHAASLAQTEAEGIGDADLFARVVLYRDRGGMPRHMAGTRVGVRLPTSDEVTDQKGQPVDIDAQPDAGATAPNFGLWYGYYRFPWFVSLSGVYLWYGHGRQDFDPGNAGTGSFLVQRGFGDKFAVQVGVDARQSESNLFSGTEDPNSGGFLAMGYAGFAVRAFSDELLFSAGVQEPWIEELNGVQDEGTTLRVGLTYDF